MKKNYMDYMIVNQEEQSALKLSLDSCGGLVQTVKNCTADCISSRLAGYWEKFSISNNRASDEPHWLR